MEGAVVLFSIAVSVILSVIFLLGICLLRRLALSAVIFFTERREEAQCWYAIRKAAVIKRK